MNAFWHKEKQQNEAKGTCPELSEVKPRHYQGIDILLKVEDEVSWPKKFFLLSQRVKKKKKILDSLQRV